ncbi:mechanosensitive ion channel domain-containing protein [Synechococcus sp. PCC 7335]|uniref:mechanosensitive ion channel domain-containing protein n=1 Tax=Synechococcus sp. (strain ATCC 29403 / PCC 7335) TaxID=91464 RepID=UPI0002F38881|nr:mechanosensitive ion channel domain-containing protein [Synechococcus sp. PCC 7335]
MLLQPGLGQSTTQSVEMPAADIVVDGRVLFRLGSIPGFTAQRRAESVNSDLQMALQTTPFDRRIRISVVERHQLSTIRVNNAHLLTVTEGDFRMGVTRQEQARDWANQLRSALAQAQQERSSSYARAVVWQIAVAFIGGLTLYVLVRKLRRRLWRWAKRSKQAAYKQRWIQSGLACLQGAIVLSFLVYVCELLPMARTARYNTIHFLKNVFNSSLLTTGNQDYSLIDITKLIVLVVMLWIAVRGLIAIVKVRFLQTTIAERGVQDAIATVMQFALMGLGLFILLQAWGIDLSALAIFASVLGVGLGFGLQDIVNNFISGWILLIERPVQVGDLIDVGGIFGSIERIGIRSTELQTVDGFSIIMPNNELVQNRVVNWSHGQPVSRIHLPLSVAYGSVIEHVHRATLEAARAHSEVLRYPRPQLRFTEFGESSLNFSLLLWIRDPRDQFDVKSDVYYLLEANFRRYQIKVPFPQRDLNLRISKEASLSTLQLQDLADTAQRQSSEKLDTVGLDTAGTKPAGIAVHLPDQLSEQTSKEDLVKPSIEQTLQQTNSIPKPGTFPADIIAKVTKYSAILKGHKGVATTEVDRLVEQMLGPNGLNISDRRFRLTHYRQCFVGSEAVTWIVRTQKATRKEAVRLGQLLVERGVFHHVKDEHSFKDEYLFYRFYKDEV